MIANDIQPTHNSQYAIANHALAANRQNLKPQLLPIIEGVEHLISNHLLKDSDYITFCSELKNLQRWLLK